MGFKTLTIKEEVYKRLRAIKRSRESYSQLLKRLSERPKIASFFGILKGGAKKAREDQRRVMEIRKRLSGSIEERVNESA